MLQGQVTSVTADVLRILNQLLSYTAKEWQHTVYPTSSSSESLAICCTIHLLKLQEHINCNDATTAVAIDKVNVIDKYKMELKMDLPLLSFIVASK